MFWHGLINDSIRDVISGWACHMDRQTPTKDKGLHSHLITVHYQKIMIHSSNWHCDSSWGCLNQMPALHFTGYAPVSPPPPQQKKKRKKAMVKFLPVPTPTHPTPPWILLLLQICQNIDGFRQNNAQGFSEFIKFYKQTHFRIVFYFHYLPNYTLALNLRLQSDVWT